MKKSNKIEFVSVVVPVYNEEGCLQELIDRTLAALDGCNRRFEFIMVDDGSRDNSAVIMKEASRKRPGVDRVRFGCYITSLVCVRT